jgi:HEPN domain-containing protein
LLSQNHYAPAVVFFVSAIELLLKATLLKPVVYGLVHHEPLAEIIVKYALGQTGFDRYEGLLSDLFKSLAGISIKEIHREGSEVKLLEECKQLQKLRNDIIHKGSKCKKEDAELALSVSVNVFDQIVRPMLSSLKLSVVEKGSIVPV